MNKIKILLADDQPLFLRGVESILLEDETLQLVGKATNSKELCEMAVQLKPEVILLDINMPIMDGLLALKHIIKEIPEVNVLILTCNENNDLLFDALRSGAKGYLLKDLLPNELLTFIHMAARGEGIISGRMASKILKKLNQSIHSDSQPFYLPDGKSNALTKREIEILSHVIKGLTNREIAKVLYISENTVKNHLRNIMEKLNINNRVQAATYALKEGWLKQL